MGEIQGGEKLLFLTDEQLRQGIETMFFAYRGFTADPDRCISSPASPAPRSPTCLPSSA
jgi:hypothetical protein